VTSGDRFSGQIFVIARAMRFVHLRFTLMRDRGPFFNPSTDMMTFSSRAAATAIASLLLMSSAFAQTTAPATPAPAAKTAPAPKAAPATAEKKAEKPRTAASLQCSKDADAKGVTQGAQEVHVDCKKARPTSRSERVRPP